MQTETRTEKVYVYTAPVKRKLKLPKLFRFQNGQEWGWVLATLAGALGLRLFNLTRLSLWYDEAADLVFAHDFDFVRTLTLSLRNNPHPPLFYPIMHLWLKFIGAGEFAVRLFSVIVAMATLVLVYFMIRRWFGQKIAFITLLLLATSSFHLYWSQSIRPYAFFALLVTLSMALAFVIIEKPEQNWRWVLYGISASVMIYTHYLAFHVVFCQAVFFTIVLGQKALTYRAMRPHEGQATLLLLTINKNWVNLLRMVITLALVAASFLPYLSNFLGQTDPNHKAVYATTGADQLVATFQAFSSWLIPGQYFFLVGAVFIPIFLFGFGRLWQTKRNLAIWLGCWIALPIMASWLSSLLIPNYRERFFIFCLPAFLIVVATGIWEAGVKRQYLSSLLLILTIGLNLAACYNYNTTYANQDWRSLVKYVVNHRQDNDLVYMAQPEGWGYLGFDYYYVLNLNAPGNLTRTGLHDGTTKEQVQELFNKYKRVWVVVAFDFTSWYDQKVKPNIPPEFKSTFYQHWSSTDQDGVSLQLLEKS